MLQQSPKPGFTEKTHSSSTLISEPLFPAWVRVSSTSQPPSPLYLLIPSTSQLLSLLYLLIHYSFVCTSRSDSQKLFSSWTSAVAVQQHPEPSSSSSRCWSSAGTPPCFVMDERDPRGNSNSSNSPSRDFLLLYHSWDVFMFLYQLAGIRFPLLSFWISRVHFRSHL